MFDVTKYCCLLLLLVQLSSCSLIGNDETTHVHQEPIDFSMFEQDTTGLVGSWKWIRTTYYYNSSGQPVIQTPATTDSTQTVIIQEEGTIKFYLNDELKDTEPVDTYLDPKQWGIRSDTLAISSAHVDGPESVFIRID